MNYDGAMWLWIVVVALFTNPNYRNKQRDRL